MLALVVATFYFNEPFTLRTAAALSCAVGALICSYF